MGERITVCINTMDRPHYLLMTLSSLLGQTYQDWDLILLDASQEPVINLEPVERLLRVFRKYQHKVRYEVDQGSGIPQTYQKGLELSETELLIRQEDDIWLEPECIDRAMDVMDDGVGAVGFMTPNFQHSTIASAPTILQNGFRKVEGHELCPNLPFIWEPSDQQELVIHEDVTWDVCIIHAGSIYRRTAADQIGGFCVHFSPIGHREESLFYTRMYMAGWNLAIRSTARLWHFEASFGGSRPEGAHAESRQQMRRSDESRFQGELGELIKAHPDRPLLYL